MRKPSAFGMLALVAILAVLIPTWLGPPPEAVAITPTVRHGLAPLPPPPTEPLPDVERIPVEHTLERGQTLSGVFADLGLEPTEAHQAVRVLGQHLDVRRVRAGEPYLALYDRENDVLEAVEWPLGQEGRVLLERREGGWGGDFLPYERRLDTRLVEATLEGSLIGSLLRAGAPESLAYAMSWVLQWDLDFNRDLRHGDTFQVLYEELYLDGLYGGLGEVLALRYVNQGREMEAYRFRGEDSYYDAEGRPLKKMFLRSPLPFSRITSRFNLRRFHPVLKRVRPHYGVDYGAPVGTPVRVTANGVVTFAGWNGGAGRMVKVRHPNEYLSAYLHLSRIAQGIRPGTRVAQGKVVGYVGSTGLSTGPHLDYRVKHRGRWINPLTIKSVPAEPIPSRQMSSFLTWRDHLRDSLETGEPLARELKATYLGDPDEQQPEAAGSSRMVAR